MERVRIVLMHVASSSFWPGIALFLGEI